MAETRQTQQRGANAAPWASDEPCENCGQPLDGDEHYDAWSDWGGDADEPDGWSCERVSGAYEAWLRWQETQEQ